MRRKTFALLRPIALYSLVALYLLWTVTPIIWVAIMSVQPEINYVTVPPHLRLQDVSPRWYIEMLSQPDVVSALKNSVIISTMTMVFCLLFGALAAYPLARLNLPLKNGFLTISVVMRMIPAIILIIPMFLMIRSLKLRDTHLGLVIVYTAFLLPYIIWMLRNFFQQIPYSLEAAARMDGCSRLGALFRVLMPAIAYTCPASCGIQNEFIGASAVIWKFTGVFSGNSTYPSVAIPWSG